MTHSHTPRKTTKAVIKPVKKELQSSVKPTEITDPLKLPKLYLAIPENWTDERIERWDAKLRLRGSHVKRPLRLYKLTRLVKSVEYCLEIENGVEV